MIIDGIRYSVSSKNMRPFFDNVIIPYLDSIGMKSYGILTQFRGFLREDTQFEDNDQFLVAFHQFLVGRTRRVRGGEEKPVLVPFDISKMNRPAWPGNLREHLTQIAMHSGTKLNIRHVVRNATLKSALKTYYNKNGAKEFAGLAQALGVQGNTLEECAKGLYKLLYLNHYNLWAGDGLTNQIIGFLSTFFQQYGLAVARGEEEYNKDLLAEQMWQAVKLVRGEQDSKKAIVNELFRIITQYIDAAEGFEEQSDALFELGLNLGFDFIDDLTDLSDGEASVAQRQEALVEVERELQSYVESAGERGDLFEIFSLFLNIGRIREEEGSEVEEACEGMDIEEANGGMDVEEEMAGMPEDNEVDGLINPEIEHPAFRRPEDDDDVQKRQESIEALIEALINDLDCGEEDALEGLELLFVNNCLITAIANAVLRRNPTIREIANIRLNLLPVTGLGELLDAGDMATILIITQTLEIDLDEIGLAIHLPGIDDPIIYGKGRRGVGEIVFDAEARHFYARR